MAGQGLPEDVGLADGQTGAAILGGGGGGGVGGGHGRRRGGIGIPGLGRIWEGRGDRRVRDFLMGFYRFALQLGPS